MGLESRDYARDGRYTASLASWGVEMTPVVKYLIIANLAVFLLQIFLTRTVPFPLPVDFGPNSSQAPGQPAGDGQKGKDADSEAVARQKQDEAARQLMEELWGKLPGMRVSVVQEWLELAPLKIQEGQLWRLLTCAFCHDRASLWHILFNMVMLYWFGTRLERMYGPLEFLLFYLAAAVVASLAYLALAAYTGSTTPAIGASGAVMGVMMLYVIYYPFETFLLFWFIPVPLCVLLGVYVLYDLHPVLLALAGDQVFTGVAHAGHLGGLAFGFLYWKLGLRLEATFGQARLKAPKQQPPRKSKARGVPVILPFAEPDALSDRLDVVLKKISEQGKASLTEEEHAVLIEASAKYRGRK